MTGDWNCDRKCKVGPTTATQWMRATISFHSAVSADVPMIGDWLGGGRTNPGIFRAGFFWILDTNGDRGIGSAFAFAAVPGYKPVIGKW